MRVWVDCTAAPHPLVLRPIIEGLSGRGHEVEITTREYGQTVAIHQRLGLEHTVVGRHAGERTGRKGWAVATRSAALLRWHRGRRFDVSLAHGSVDLPVVSTLRRIPSVQMQDYEYAGLQRKIAWRLAKTVIVPDVIPLERLEAAGARPSKLVRFPGLKEDYYLADFTPDPEVIAAASLDAHGIRPDRSTDDRILAIVRPPPESSAYHADNPLFDRVLDRILGDDRAVAVFFPRTGRQRTWATGLGADGLVIPDGELDAQSLIAFADLVVSAGGTMNREAVALGTPAYTVFSGRMGAVDEHLISEGRMRALHDPDDITLSMRDASPGPVSPRDAAPLVDAVERAAKGPRGR